MEIYKKNQHLFFQFPNCGSKVAASSHSYMSVTTKQDDFIRKLCEFLSLSL